ncbi:TPA: formate dehydrogenase cytochrome b556 subunit, partial [Klebsiella michiganensis]
VSGLGFFFPSFNWLMHIMGTPQLARILHPFVGVIMFASFIIMFFRYWHHNLINRDDIFWAKNIRKIIVNEDVGDTGHYNFGQKCVFWAAIIFLVLLLVSGVIIWRPYFAPAFSIPVIRFALMLHSFSAVALIVVIMVHIYAALWVKGTITAMVEGWVTKTWAKKHHPRWYREVKAKRTKD